MRPSWLHSTTVPNSVPSQASLPSPRLTWDRHLHRLPSSSHANMHSQSHPHYCPVPSCPRSQGGKGFKRKNEMIRHGLVHACAGYICPFCPDREHKYPRPDNLQRCEKCQGRQKSRRTANNFIDMYWFIIPIKQRTTRCCVRFLLRGLRVVLGGGGGGGKC